MQQQHHLTLGSGRHRQRPSPETRFTLPETGGPRSIVWPRLSVCGGLMPACPQDAGRASGRSRRPPARATPRCSRPRCCRVTLSPRHVARTYGACTRACASTAGRLARWTCQVPGSVQRYQCRGASLPCHIHAPMRAYASLSGCHSARPAAGEQPPGPSPPGGASRR